MRRLLFFVGFLGLLGLSTAFASNFSVGSEQVQSFVTPTSLERPPVPVARIYVFGDPGALQIGGSAPTDGSHQVELEPYESYSWDSPPAGGSGFHIDGFVTLRLHRTGTGTDLLSATLLVCDGESCVPIADADGTEQSIEFGSIDQLIEPGSHLRLVITNNNEDECDYYECEYEGEYDDTCDYDECEYDYEYDYGCEYDECGYGDDAVVVPWGTALESRIEVS